MLSLYNRLFQITTSSLVDEKEIIDRFIQFIIQTLTILHLNTVTVIIL